MGELGTPSLWKWVPILKLGHSTNPSPPPLFFFLSLVFFFCWKTLTCFLPMLIVQLVGIENAIHSLGQFLIYECFSLCLIRGIPILECIVQEHLERKEGSSLCFRKGLCFSCIVLTIYLSMMFHNCSVCKV